MTALLAPKPNPNQRGTEERSSRWNLREIRRPQRTMANIPFVLSLGVMLALGMVGLLLLNTALQEQAFAVRDQQKVATQLGYRMAALETEATQARSSAGLAAAASKLGMVPNPYPVYLQMPGGDIVGKPTAMTGQEVPDIRYRTPDQLAAIAMAREEEAKKKAAETKQKAAEAKQKAEAAAEKKAAAEKPGKSGSKQQESGR